VSEEAAGNVTVTSTLQTDPELDNDNRVVGGSEAEGLRIHAKGYRKALGSILWIARNATPMASYAASILSKCMQVCSQNFATVQWRTAPNRRYEV
jgi:hypothetical protein